MKTIYLILFYEFFATRSFYNIDCVCFVNRLEILEVRNTQPEDLMKFQNQNLKLIIYIPL